MSETAATAGTPRIVVGVDASKESEEALRWAAEYAKCAGARLDVVHAWHIHDERAWIETLPPPAGRTDVARESLSRVVGEFVGPHPEVVVTTSLVEGHAVRVLCDRARGALLLVVGCRGLGGFDGLLLGSVSAACAAHAPCSVMVVRPD